MPYNIFVKRRIHEVLEKQGIAKQAGLSAALSAIPGLGGLAHGIIDPEEGASRLETGLAEGLGSGAGGAAGLLGAAYLAQHLKDTGAITDPDNSLTGVLAALGTGAGSFLGSIPARFLVKREDTVTADELKELKDILTKYEAVHKGSDKPVSINISTGMPLEADKESGEDEEKENE